MGLLGFGIDRNVLLHDTQCAVLLIRAIHINSGKQAAERDWHMIKSIAIKNFKSLRKVSVDLEPITVLVGRGGTGKSNFLQAIAFVRDCLLKKNDAIRQDGGWTRFLCATALPTRKDRTPEIEFTVRFSIPGQEGDFQYKLMAVADVHNMNTVYFPREALSHGDDTIFDRDGSVWAKPPALRPLPLTNPMTLELASGIPEVGLSFLILTAGIGCYDFNGDVLRTKPNQSRQNPREPGLADDANNYLQCFENISRNLQKASAQQEIIAALRKLKPSLIGLGVAPQSAIT